MINNWIIYIVILFSMTINFAWSAEATISKFASVRSSEANLRTGPNVRYPIKWIIVKRYEPVEVTSTFEKWQKVRDCYGDEGWIHESLLVNKRHAVIMGDVDKMIRAKANSDSKAVAIVKPNVRVELKSCKDNWCLIQSGTYKGWVERSILWGVNKDETF